MEGRSLHSLRSVEMTERNPVEKKVINNTKC